jgi:RNA polymerase sigma-70 factor (ECF subfamily)
MSCPSFSFSFPVTTNDATALIEAAYDSYADAIFRHCYFRLLKRELAKELMQETFIKAMDYVKKGQEIENMRALLYKIANNLIIDDVRKRKETSLDALHDVGFDPAGADEESVRKHLEEQRVMSTLAKLPSEDRELVVMRFVDELKPREIAEQLKLSPNVVSVRLHRAMKDLKDLLKSA